jgi:hypothetical protein
MSLYQRMTLTSLNDIANSWRIQRNVMLFNTVQRCSMLFNAMQIRLGLELCIDSLYYQPQEHLLTENELTILSTAREAAVAMLFNAVQRCSALFNAVQRYAKSSGTGTLHWQSLFPTARASTDRV